MTLYDVNTLWAVLIHTNENYDVLATKNQVFQNAIVSIWD